MQGPGTPLQSAGRWMTLGLAVLLLSLFWHPYGLLIATIVLLVGGAAMYQRSRDSQNRAIALGALGGGAVGAVILLVAVGYFAFAATVREGQGVETRVPAIPIQRAPTVTTVLP